MNTRLLLSWPRLLGLLLLGLLATAQVRAQAPTVRATVLVLPPYSTHLSDYADQPNRLIISLTNLSRTPVSLQLAGTLTGDNGVRAQTKPGARSPRPIALDVLQTRTLDRDELGQLLDANQLDYTGTSAQDIVRGNGLPEGSYTLCVRALDYATGRPLSAEEPVGCSRPFALRSLEPPYLIKPLTDEVIRATAPQNIVFTWSRPAGAPISTEYELRIVEMSDNRRNINDAFLSGTVPPLFERTVSGATVLLYGPAEPALVVGRRYAFAVTARDPQGRAVFRNNGRSEVSSFVYGTGPAPVRAAEPVAAAQPGKPQKPLKVKISSVVKIPTALIRGHLQWGWRAGEETTITFPQTAGLGLDLNGTALAAANDVSAGPVAAAALGTALHAAGKGSSNSGASPAPGGASASASANSGAAGSSAPGPLAAVTTATTGGANAALLGHTSLVSGGGTTTGVSVANGLNVAGNGQLTTGNNASSATGLLTLGIGPEMKLPAVLGKNRYPLANQKIKLVFDYKRIPKGQMGWNDPMLNAEQHEVLGIGATDGSGNFAVSILVAPPVEGALPQFVKGNKTYEISRLRVEVTDPHFFGEPTGYQLTAAADGGFELGETLCLANSYRLKLELVDKNNQPVTGGVQVKLYRDPKWYSAHAYARPEGMAPEGNRPMKIGFDGGILITESASPKTELVRLFTNHSSADDQYRITVVGDGYNNFSTTLSAWPAGTSYADGVVTITKKYTLVGNLPQVRGRVLRKHDNSPVAGANVQLFRTKGATKWWKTQTDSQGRFVIANVPSTTSSSINYDFTLEVLPGPGIGKGWKTKDVKMNKTGPAGIAVFDPILVDAVLHPVVGRVVSDEGGSVAQANLRWKSGGMPFQADAEGRFLTTHQAGADTLVINKLGYQALRAGVQVDGDGLANPNSGKKGSDNFFVLDGPGATPKALSGAANSLGKTLGKASSLQVNGAAPFQLPGAAVSVGASGPASAGGAKVGATSGAGVGYSLASNNQYAGGTFNSHDALLNYLGNIGSADAPLGDSQDLGKFTLNKLVGRLRVTVLDSATAQPLAGATVTFPDATPALSQATGADGNTYFEKAPGGPVGLRISGPSGGAVAYVPALQDLTIVTNGSVTELTVRLAPGTRVQGTVQAGGQAVADAKVRVLGRPDLAVQTAPNGQYELVGVPKGPWTLEATKQSLVGQSQSQTFVPGQNATVNFELTSAGFAIDKLLGFAIEVKTLAVGADTTLTGAFVNLPGNAVFAAKPDLRLEFANVPVRVTKSGLLRPKGHDFVLTDVTELALTAFQFLPVKIAEPTGLKVQMQGGNPAKGQVAGAVEINYGTLGHNLGWAWAEGTKTYLSDAAGSGAVPALPVLTSDGQAPAGGQALRLRAPAKSAGLTLYGFAATVDLLKSTVGADGLHLAGSVKLDKIPGLGAAKIDVANLWISPGGDIKAAALGFTPPVALSVGGFGFTLGGGSLSEVGFKLNGAVKVQPPGSAASTVNFSDLTIGNGQLYGGNFVLPSAGLDVFGLAKLRPVAGAPLAFGSLPNGGASYFSGGATTTLPLLNKTLTIESFTVRSDGQFSAQLTADYNADFGCLATLHLTSVKFNTIGGVGIDVLSDVHLALPLVKAEAGNLRYRPGHAPSLENVGLHIPIGVGELGGSVSFLNNGFAGSLGLNLVSVMNVKANFKYQKLNGDVQFAANIQTGIPPVPIGPGLALSSIGGGLSYGGHALKSVTVSGVVSVLGIEAGLALNPIQVTVMPGPVIVGTASLTVYAQKMANANLTLDFPNSLASVQINTDYNPLPAVGTASAGGIVVVSGKANDTYWVMGLGAQAKLLGLLNVNANILVGQNLNVDAHPELAFYTSFIDKAYLTGGNRVNGAHLQGSSFFGRTKENAFNKCFWEACGKIWYYNESVANLNSNFASGIYGVSIASGWGGGAELSIAGKNIGGADVGAEGAVAGSYNNAKGWNISGRVGAHLVGWLGNCSSACANKICWGGCFNACIFGCEVCPIPVGIKVCAHPGILVEYSSNSGMDVGLDI